MAMWRVLTGTLRETRKLSLGTRLLTAFHRIQSIRNEINVHCVYHLTSTGPCIVIYFYTKNNQMHQCNKFILFCNDTLHVSDGLSVHHQEFKTVHTATSVPSETCRVLFQNKYRHWCI